MESAPTAIDDSLSSAVARRTRRRRVRARMGPIGTSTKAGATRLPTSPCSAFDRTETGTMTRSVRPFVPSPRCSKRSCSPLATAASTTSFTVPPSACLISRTRRKVVSAIANRRAGPISVSNGPAGGAPMSTTSRRPDRVSPSRASCGRGRRRRDRSPREGGARGPAPPPAADPRGLGEGAAAHGVDGGSPSGWSGARSKRAEAIVMPAIPSASAWCSFNSTAVRRSASPSKT